MCATMRSDSSPSPHVRRSLSVDAFFKNAYSRRFERRAYCLRTKHRPRSYSVGARPPCDLTHHRIFGAHLTSPNSSQSPPHRGTFRADERPSRRAIVLHARERRRHRELDLNHRVRAHSTRSRSRARGSVGRRRVRARDTARRPTPRRHTARDASARARDARRRALDRARTSSTSSRRASRETLRAFAGRCESVIGHRRGARVRGAAAGCGTARALGVRCSRSSRSSR